MRLSNSGLTVSTTNKIFDCEHWTIQGRINLYGKCVCVKWKRLINIYDLVALHRIFELATCSDYISAGFSRKKPRKVELTIYYLEWGFSDLQLFNLV